MSVLNLPAVPCRFSLTPNGRRRFARAMLQSSSLAAREAFSEGGVGAGWAGNRWLHSCSARQPPWPLHCTCLQGWLTCWLRCARHLANLTSCLLIPGFLSLPLFSPAHPTAPPPGGSTPAIARQLDALGSDHVGYSSKRFPELGLTLVGARPFSKGGKQWSDVAGEQQGRVQL